MNSSPPGGAGPPWVINRRRVRMIEDVCACMTVNPGIRGQPKITTRNAWIMWMAVVMSRMRRFPPNAPRALAKAGATRRFHYADEASRGAPNPRETARNAAKKSDCASEAQAATPSGRATMDFRPDTRQPSVQPRPCANPIRARTARASAATFTSNRQRTAVAPWSRPSAYARPIAVSPRSNTQGPSIAFHTPSVFEAVFCTRNQCSMPASSMGKSLGATPILARSA